jgi:mercuric ion binding protein
MTCAMCAVTIKKALQQVEGVQKVIVNYDAKTALVTFDNQKTDISVLINSTTNTGYTSSLITPNSL